MSLKRSFHRFGAERKGVAALEFAILLPMMVFLLFGTVDLLDMLDTNRRVENAAASIADVVARDTEVSNDEVTGLWAALGVLMFPDDATGIDARVTSITVESAATARVVWSEGHGMAALVANSTVSLPAGMMRAGTSIIMTETELEYGAPLRVLLPGPATLRHTAYRRSRLVDPIPRVAA
jgi:Flp pilus assembly protein TadG